MSFYAGMAATAKQLLDKYGQVVTVTRTINGAFDPAMGTESGETQTSFTASAAVFDYETSQIDGESIKKGDKRTYLESTNAPKNNDVVTTSDGDLKVVGFTTIGPSGEAVVYVLQLRY